MFFIKKKQNDEVEALTKQVKLLVESHERMFAAMNHTNKDLRKSIDKLELSMRKHKR